MVGSPTRINIECDGNRDVVFAQAIPAKRPNTGALFVRHIDFILLFTAALTLIRLSCIIKCALEFMKSIQNSRNETIMNESNRFSALALFQLYSLPWKTVIWTKLEQLLNQLMWI